MTRFETFKHVCSQISDKIGSHCISRKAWLVFYSTIALLYGKLDGWAWISFMIVVITAREFAKNVQNSNGFDITTLPFMDKLGARTQKFFLTIISFKTLMLFVGCSAHWRGNIDGWQWVAMTGIIIGGIEYVKRNAFLKGQIKILE